MSRKEIGVITLQELQTQVDELARKINAPAKFFPTFGSSNHDGTPHIEIDGNTYYYLAYDRDVVCTRRKTTKQPKLLYWIFEEITLKIGSAYIREHREEIANPRGLAVQYQLELLETLHQQWRELREQETADTLERQSYRDVLF